MGRIVDLCGEVAAAADDGPEGPTLSAEAWDRLRADPSLLAAYVAEKRAILGAGVTDPEDSSNAKTDFVRAVVRSAGPSRRGDS